jgi:hypothetical protein
MENHEKLRTLLHHWMEHNDEHAETYREWAEKAAATGNQDVAAVLMKLCDETKKLTPLMKEAMDKLG